MAKRERIDKLLLERGLAETRARAQALVMAGEVLVGDHRVDKPGQLVDPELPIRLKGEGLRYVSRGALKLEGALDTFGIDPAGLRCVDLGASTGGFTDLLLQRGAEAVWAVDVGYGQLHEKLRQDPRVHSFERVNARTVGLEQLGAEPFDLAVMDLSFISLELVLPAARSLVRPGGQLVMLVKPQFEVGPKDVGNGGVVRDPEKRQEAIDRIADFCRGLRLEVRGIVDSPILGPAGNLEALLWAARIDSQES
ncbi:TlyA family RNA methyltransferase [Vulgatibacter incomptus]|uniref:RNA binding methyltransferase FtsJ like protein n=1 Tax=Vulgatibacter incomptus TaxID=1391653 RepID=A0A0K1PBU5_9BACT|nr:TlyA family RNA methyltransferase [Vulgatibacter incomptus]AKU90876.1 RNA binding methyltransferase FtsJ like protein [Vulgatibacter incomptus]